MNWFWKLALCVALLATPIAGQTKETAENYPTGPITSVCTYSVGSQTDVQARICAMMAEKYFHQPMVILNKPGAGGLTGWNWFIEHAPKDGLMMTVYNLPNFIAQSIVKKNAKYNIHNIEPLANFAAEPVVLFVPKDSQFNNVQELVDYAKANPGKVTLNGSGLFVGHHIALLLLSKEAGINLTYIPEKGGSDALQSIMAAKVMGGFNNLSIALRAPDKLKVLGIAANQRHEYMPDVPTFIEQGFKTVGEATANFRGFGFPAGVDPAIIDKAAKDTYDMIKDPTVVEKFKQAGIPYRLLNREEMKKVFAEREAILKDLLKDYVEK